MQLQHLYFVYSNPFYMGLIRLESGETHRGAFPAMVTPEEFDRAQLILGRPGRSRPSRHEFTYAGLLRCLRCGDVLTPEEHIKPSGKRYVYYRCRRRLNKPACTLPSLPEEIFEQAVAANLARLTIPHESLDWMLENARRSYEGDATRRRAARDSLQDALTAAARESEMLLTLRLRGQVGDVTFEARRVEIADRTARLRLQLERPEASPDDLIDRVERVLTFAANAAAAFSVSDGVRRRGIVQAVSSNWNVEGKKCVYVAKEPFSYIEKSGGTQDWWTCLVNVRTWLSDNFANFSLPDLNSAGAAETVPSSDE
jgi:hypothetical protein